MPLGLVRWQCALDLLMGQGLQPCAGQALLRCLLWGLALLCARCHPLLLAHSVAVWDQMHL